MADSDSIPFGAVIAADIMSAFMLPGGATLSKLADQYLAKRRREAADILIQELQAGRHGEIRFEEHDIDPLLEITMRFSKAVDEGAARRNLRLLAQVIAGLKRNKTFDPDRFRRWCGILEQLTRDELVALGRAYILAIKLKEVGKEADSRLFSQSLLDDLKFGGYVPLEIEALFVSLARTGIFIPMPAFGSINYIPSPWLFELGGLADLAGNDHAIGEAELQSQDNAGGTSNERAVGR
jgi:hypothetical protein